MKKFLKIVTLLFLAFECGYCGTQYIVNKHYEYTKSQTLEAKESRTKDIYAKLRLYTGQYTVPLVLLQDRIVNAWTDNENVFITTGLLSKLTNDDEIAFLLSHEMSHVMMYHLDPWNKILIVDKEAQADKMGTYLTLRAGYDICKGRNFWKILDHLDSGDIANPLWTDHPSNAYRYYANSMPWCGPEYGDL